MVACLTPDQKVACSIMALVSVWPTIARLTPDQKVARSFSNMACILGMDIIYGTDKGSVVQCSAL